MRQLRRRQGAPRAPGPALVIAAVAVATVAGLVAHPATADTGRIADHVIIAGAVGLRWDDVDPQRTPQLWRLAETGSIGALSVRSGHRPTCPIDGWLTLGAGNWAAGFAGRVDSPCASMDVTVDAAAGAGGAFLPDRPAVVRHNQRELPWGAVPGALAGSVRSAVAVGDGAAVAAARSTGRVDVYEPEVPHDAATAADLLACCALGIVDLGEVSGTGERRAASVRRVDAMLERVLAARPDRSLLLVAGVADTDPAARLHVVVGHAPDLGPGWLTSTTTGRTGYLQLVDLAPTALAAIGQAEPAVRLAGHPARSEPGRTGDLTEDVAELAAADREAGRTRPVAMWFFAVLAVALLGLFGAVVPLLRRTGRRGPANRALAHPRIGRSRLRWAAVAPVLLVVAALAIPAALVAGTVPWWRAGTQGAAFAATSLAVLAVTGALVVRNPIFRRTLALIGACAGIGAGVVAADLVTGSRLQLNGVAGYSALDGGRFAGLGAVGLGILIVGTLLVAGCLAERVERRWRPAVVVAVGAVGVTLAGSGYLGADIPGAVAMIIGVGLAAALSPGGWLTAARLGWAAGLATTVTVAVAVVDLTRPAQQRAALGSAIAELADGTAGYGLHQVALANAEALTTSPLTLLAVGSGAFVWAALLRPWGGLRRLFGIHPALRAGALGAVVASLSAGVLTGTALTVAGAAAAVAVPLATVAALRVREQSAHAAAQVLE